MMQFDVPEVTIPDIITSHAKWHPKKTALVFGLRRVSWREFNSRINRVAHALLELGLRQGDKVSLLSGNRIEMAEIIFGTLKAGGVIVPLSAMVPGEGLARMIADSDSKALFADPLMGMIIAPHRPQLTQVLPAGFFSVGFAAEGWAPYETRLAQVPDQDPGIPLRYADDFNIIYSSGTTGTPKGIVHTHAARRDFALALAVDLRIDSSSIPILSTPMYHNGTWMIMLPALIAGATTVIMEHFDPRGFLELVQKERGTHTFFVPTQFIVVMGLPDFEKFDVSSLKIMVSAGAPLRRDTKEQILKKFTRNLLELYGLTEGIGSTLEPEEMEGKIGSVGTPIAGTDIRIIDDQGRELSWGGIGEIVGYSPGLLRGYYRQPEKTAEAIWKDEAGRTYLKTGDVGKFDEDGFLYILDRKKDMILSGGINIFATDIEEVVARHPAVLDVAVIGVPHEKWGETPLALVVRKPGAAAGEDAIKDWANPQLAKFQRLSRVEFRDSLPRSPIGKVLKRVLREPYWQEGGKV